MNIQIHWDKINAPSQVATKPWVLTLCKGISRKATEGNMIAAKVWGLIFYHILQIVLQAACTVLNTW